MYLFTTPCRARWEQTESGRALLALHQSHLQLITEEVIELIHAQYRKYMTESDTPKKCEEKAKSHSAMLKSLQHETFGHKKPNTNRAKPGSIASFDDKACDFLNALFLRAKENPVEAGTEWASEVTRVTKRKTVRWKLHR